MTKRTYYVMAERDDATKPWAVQFGSYTRDDVVCEIGERRDAGVKGGDIKLVTTHESQASIDAAIAKLNGRVGLGGRARPERRHLTVRFETDGYQWAHGKAPRGYGQWAFTALEMDGGKEVFWAPSSTYSEAKKWARKHILSLTPDDYSGPVTIEVQS